MSTSLTSRRMRFPNFGNALHLGTTADGEPVCLSAAQRAGHTHCTGITGRGKTSFLEHCIRQDILNWRASGSGVILIDQHGSLYDALIRWIAMFPAIQRLPIIPIDLRRDDRMISYNILRHRPGVPAATVASNLTEAIAHVMRANDAVATPRFAKIAGALFQALYDSGLGIDAAYHALDVRNTALRERLIQATKDEYVRSTLAELGARKSADATDEVSSTRTRLWQLLQNPRLRAALGDSRASLDLLTVLSEGAILLVCTSTDGAQISDRDGDVFATLLLSDLWMTARQRGKRAAHRPTYVYLDEFQTIATPSITRSLDQARGFGLHLILSHQFPAQLKDLGEIGNALYRSIMQNTANTIVFNSQSDEDTDPLAKKLFTGVVNPDQIKHVMTTMRVVNYVDEEIESFTESETQGHTTNRSHTSSSSSTSSFSSSGGSSRGNSVTYGNGSREVVVERYNAEGELIGREMRRTRSEDGDDDDDTLADSWGANESTTDSYADAVGNADTIGDAESASRSAGRAVSRRLRPILRQEVSSIAYRPLEEQFFLARQAIFRLPKRHALVRLDGELGPRLMRTATVQPSIARPRWVERALGRITNRLHFVAPLSELRDAQSQRLTLSGRARAQRFTREDEDSDIDLARPSFPSLGDES